MSSMGKNVSTDPAPPITPFTTRPVSQRGAPAKAALHEAPESCHPPFEYVLHRKSHLVREEENQGEYAEENGDAEERPGQQVIDPVGHQHLTPLESRYGYPRHHLDPVVPAPHHCPERVFMLDEQTLDLVPCFRRQESLEGPPQYLGVALHQLRRDPPVREARRDVVADDLEQPGVDGVMIGRYFSGRRGL